MQGYSRVALDYPLTRMKRIAGHKLAIIGLFLGLIAGLSVSIFKHWLSNEIADSIEDEVKAACPTCSLAFDTFSISFLTLSGKATHVRILQKGSAKLSFAELRAKFSIDDILERKIALTSITLSGGYADGVGPNSVTFKFIDQLTTPIPPELDSPGRWHVTLDKLEIKSAHFREPLGGDELVGTGVSLLVTRSGDDFALRPGIKNLTYRLYDSITRSLSRELDLGPLSADLLIRGDGVTSFSPIEVSRDSSRVSLAGTMDSNLDNLCSGSGTFGLTPGYIGLPEWISGHLSGEALVSGVIENPQFRGSITKGNSPLTLSLPYATPLSLARTEGAFSIDLRHGSPLVTLERFVGSSEHATIRSASPLTFSSEGLSAEFDAQMPQFDYGPFSVVGVKARIKILPLSWGLRTEITAEVENLKSQGIVIGPSSLSLAITGERVEYSVKSTDPRQGALRASGVIELLTAGSPTLSQGTLELVDFRYPLSLPVSETALSPVALTSSVTLSGPLDLSQLNAAGSVTYSFPSLLGKAPAVGTLKLEKGVLSSEAKGEKYGGTALATLNLVKDFTGKLQVRLTDSSLKYFVEGIECSALDGILDYSFPLANPLEGSGTMNVTEASLGCAPYKLSFSGTKQLPIVGGAVRLDGSSITGGSSSLKLRGNAGILRGYDMALQGDLLLSALLPFAPGLDNLAGNLSTSLSVKGNLSTPQLSGNAKLLGGEIGLVSPDLTITGAQGTFEMTGDTIKIRSLSGSVNEGQFEIQGGVDLRDLTNSKVQASFANVEVNPMQDTTLTLAGSISLEKSASGSEVLAGDLNIVFAEVAKDIDPSKMLMQALAGYLLPTETKAPSTRVRGSPPINLELDLAVHAARNVFVLTPLLSAEFSVDMRVRGTAANPAVRGEMQVLSGWLGLKENRFDITAGTLAFKPGSLEPILDMVGEGLLRSNTGENILVIMEASGPVSAPRIFLSSDQGLSNDQLLLLLTSNRSLVGRTLANTVGRQLGLEQRFFLSRDSFDSFGSFFRSLTRIDSLSVEPIFNPFTGQTEPAVVGQKNLTDRLIIAGQSTLGAVQNARAGLVYNLTPSLNASGFIETVPSRQNTALRADLTYTILSQQVQLVAIDVRGAEQMSRDEVLSAARIGPASRIKNTPKVIETIANEIRNFYVQKGHLAIDVTVMCTAGAEYCSELSIALDEGSAYRVSELVVKGDVLPGTALASLNSLDIKGQLISSELLQEIERRVVIAARNEGYVAARVAVEADPSHDPLQSRVVVTTELRQPISFVFSGNSVFSAEDFLNSIELFTRKRPFGNNTIQLLVQNIERMYQDSGYLLVEVSFTERRSDSDRVTYFVEIKESTRAPVAALKLVGNSNLSLKKIKFAMKELGFSQQLSLLSPEYAVPAQMDALKETIEAVYQNEGYQNVAVQYEIIPSANNDFVDIQFQIDEGVGVQIQSVSLLDMPEGVTPPTPPVVPLSIPRVNRYMTLILERLRDEGFLFPSVSSSPAEANDAIEIAVEAGARTILSSVTFDGLGKIQEEVARQYSMLTPSTPYSAQNVNSTKRRLLRSGLFSRVEVEPVDGILDSPQEALVVRVTERPLQTLEVGGGANSEFGLHLFGEAVDKSLFADGQSLALRLDSYFGNSSSDTASGVGISQGFASLRFVNPNLLNTDVSFSEELRYQRQDVTTFEFNQDRLSLASYLYSTLGTGTTASFGHTILLDDLASVSPGAVLSDLDEGTVRIGFLSAILALDRRDDALLPQEGYTFTLEPKLASSLFGSEANFSSLTARASTILPLEVLSPRFSLALGAGAGVSRTFGGTDIVPITQRFYLGGRTTVRGFRENSLGPRSTDGAVLGGDTFVMVKSQLQYLATPSISTHMFLDFGDLYLSDVPNAGSDLRSSAGVGFRFLSPIGPLGIDIGHPLDEQGGEPSFRFHFSVGSSF